MKIFSKIMAMELGALLRQLLKGELEDPAALARKLDFLANEAWLEAIELTPPSIRID